MWVGDCRTDKETWKRLNAEWNVATAGSDTDPRKLERDRQPLQLENWLTGLDWTAGDVGG